MRGGLRDEVVLAEGIIELLPTNWLLQELFYTFLVAELSEAREVVARAHKDGRGLELLALLLRPTLLVLNDHQL